MDQTPKPSPRTFHSSRWGALLRLRLPAVFHPWSMTLADASVSTLKVRSVLFPWIREQEHLTYDSISSVIHVSGLIWDGVVIETRGGVNTLTLPWLRKREAPRLVAALRCAAGAPPPREDAREHKE